MNIFQIIIVIIFLVELAYANKLKLIQVIFRHGEMAPDRKGRIFYPLDPHIDETWYPHGPGGLNNAGKKSAYELGVFLRKRYGEWLGDVYLENDVLFKSSNNSRVVTSTQLVAAGLYPPSEIQKWNPQLNWQPIPVYFETNAITIFTMWRYNCPVHKAMQKELEETNEWLRNRNKELREFFDFVGKNIGMKTGQSEVSSLYQCLNAKVTENVELPAWTEGIFPVGKLSEIAAYTYVLQTYNATLLQMTAGPWMRELLDNIDDRLNSSRKSDLKGKFYGAHDSTVAWILAALKIFEPHTPFYSSAIILELFESDDEFYVKVLYRNKKVLREMLIPGCQAIDCPLSTFRKLFDDIIVEDPIALCKGLK